MEGRLLVTFARTHVHMCVPCSIVQDAPVEHKSEITDRNKSEEGIQNDLCVVHSFFHLKTRA